MSRRNLITLFLCGDVMTGRGIDQVLPHPCPPRLYEPAVTSALDYVVLAEEVNGPIQRPVDDGSIWGEALEVLEAVQPDVRIINLETSVTTSEDAEPKGINYRMHPANVPVLTAAKIDCCVLANNHVLDWGQAGLLETLEVLGREGLPIAGAGRDLPEARAPARLMVPDKGRVLVFAFGATDSGIPRSWAAAHDRPGVCCLPDFSDQTVEDIARRVQAVRQPGDLAVASIHWGGNWGYDIPASHQRFARGLIERGGIDLVHGHSSHHPKAIEIYRGRPIFYGCGDFLNDYEGIGGHEEFRNDLTLMYFPTQDVQTGELVRLEMIPMQIRTFRLHRASTVDAAWLRNVLDRECRRFGHRVTGCANRLILEWGDIRGKGV